MKRFAFVLFATLTFQFVSIACIEVRNPQALLYMMNIAMTRQIQCQIQAGGGAMLIARVFNILDFALGNRYFVFPLIRNHLPSIFIVNQTSNAEHVSETHIVRILGAHVEYDIGDLAKEISPDVLQNEFTDPTFVYSTQMVAILPEQTGIISLEVLPYEKAKHLKEALSKFAQTQAGLQGVGAEIIVHVTIEGVLLDGTIVSSKRYSFPLKLCFGCLIVPTVPDCSALPEGIEAPCLPGQDDPVDCRVCCVMGGDPDICGCLPD